MVDSTEAQTARCGALLLELVDHLATEPDGPTVLTALNAVVLIQLERFGGTIDTFVEMLREMKPRRDAQMALNAARRRGAS